jgi:hypothetical protein
MGPIEAIVLGSTTIIITIFWSAVYLVRLSNENEQKSLRLIPEAYESKRKILEQQRDVWYKSWQSVKDPVLSKNSWDNVTKIDNLLLNLEDERKE